jgi:thiosulfate sulfurtransferase
MSTFKHISVADCQALMQSNVRARMIDIRDLAHFTAGHVKASYHFQEDTFAAFLEQVKWDDPIIVICYRGNSSQRFAQQLSDLGYLNVYNLIGGFTAWKTMII